jgi:hexosaminidase
VTGGEPRFAWRGVMLDVARHFFGPDDVKRFVDVISRFGFNRLHLHLTDDQGWRIEIPSWPRLAKIGGASEVGGGPGGWYSQEQYAALVEYAEARGVVVVPEIDLPGHVNAAVVAYPELSLPGLEVEPYTGIDVGFSCLDVTSLRVQEFVDDVVRELASLTPGPYVHIGGDEVFKIPHEDYVAFVEFACATVRAHGKQPVGWEEIAQGALEPGTIVQHWKKPEHAREAVRKGAQVLMSPASRTYVDMKYDADTELGKDWAGHVSLRDAYEWDPAAEVEGVSESEVIGVEAALWSETFETMHDVALMAFPRLLALAEVASMPQDGRSWDGFRARVPAAAHELDGLGVAYFRSPEVDWR